jgi:poly(A) polymerase
MSTADATPYLPEALSDDVFGQLRVLNSRFELYVIGGYVRDHLLARPCKDIDIVTLGSGVELARAFAEQVGSTEVAYYENFGTALVRFGEWSVEFVGARRESYRKSSRKPIVEDGTLHDDQIRRDFTVNALSLSLNDADFGQLIDPFGGLEDLRSGILRTPTDPDITFSDDPLRMLRGIRFAATLGFRLDDVAFEAIKRNRERIGIVSGERVAEELNKMVLAPKPSVGFLLMFKTGLLDLIFPEMVKLYGVEVVNGISHKDNFYHTLKVLDNISETTDDLWLRWSAILHDIAKPPTKRFDPRLGWTFHGHEERGARMVPKLFARLKLPQNEKMRFVQKMVRMHLRPIALVDDGVSDSAIRRLIFDAGDDLEALMKLCRADITTRDARKMDRYLHNFRVLEEKIEEVEARDHLRNWQPPVTGEMIMETFKLKPGPAVGDIKTAVRNAILDGDISSDAESAIAYMHKIAPEIIARPARERGSRSEQDDA